MPRSAVVLLALGAALVVAGLVVWAGRSVGLGHLPGDVVFGRGQFRLYAPIASSVLISVVATVALNLILRH